MFLVVEDAHSKWLDVHMTSSTTTSATLELLRRSFATLGMPEVVVSDNAANFTSDEFSCFMKKMALSISTLCLIILPLMVWQRKLSRL